MSIFGAGGSGGGKGKGGGGGGGASEAKDNLDSTSYAKIIELLSEGEIEGFATPSSLGLTQGTVQYDNAALKDMFFNDTPILRASADNLTPNEADFNFRNVNIATRFGTQTQSYVPGFDAAENVVPVNAIVEAANPETRAITNTSVDAVRITIDVPQLQEITDRGDIIGGQIDLSIAIQYNSGGYVTVITDSIIGRTGDLYQRDYIVNLDTINGVIAGTYSQAGTTVTVTTATPHNLSTGTAFFADILSGSAVTSTNLVADVISLTSFSYVASTSLTTSGSIRLNDSFPVDIRVTRITPDSTSSKLENKFLWSNYTELIYEKLRYPNSAYVALRIDAEQFSSIPSRSYKIRGIKVAIPSNATVDINNGRLIYSGVWNGTFGPAQWCSDPAWILWDLIVSTRYGLGDHIQANTLDKWAFYRASQYCSEMVPTGLNSPASEPRFSCNVNIQTAEEAYKLINDLCSVFRAMPFWGIGSITVAQDRPSDPMALFTLANVSEAGFTYEGSSIKTRATVAIVGWLNLDLRDIDREIVEDAEGISKYGVITKEVSAFACTSRAQAHRIGEWLLYTERYETEVVSFATGLESGVVLRPGSIIEIADPVKSGQRRAGRISSATTTAITVDNIGDVVSGQLSVVLPDGIVENRNISSVSGNVVTVASAFSAAPQAGSVWLCDGDAVAPTQWRVLGVQEQDGISFAVSAVAHNSSKYAYIERGAALESRTISVLNVPPDAPTNLTSEELQYVLNGRVATKLSLTWKPVRDASKGSGVNEYKVRWRGEYSNWQEQRVYGPVFEIGDVTQGVYNIEVSSISATQVISSAPTSLIVNVTGVTAPPANPTGVSLVPINESSAIIQWNLATNLDVLVGGEVLIRHDPRSLSSGAEWSSSNAIVQAAAGNQTQKQVPLLDGTYFIAFRDQSRVRSLAPVGIPAVLPTPQPRFVVKTWTENPTFSGGTNTNLPYNAGKGGLFLNPASGLTGERIYADTLDMGQVYDINIRRRIVSTPDAIAANFDDVTGPSAALLALGAPPDTFETISIASDSPPGYITITRPGDFDGSDLDQVNAVTYVRTTQDNPAGTPTWSAWNEYANAIVRARGIQLKVIATTISEQVGMVITELGATAELQQRTESGSGSGSSTYNITFASAFYAAPEVTISPSNMATGDYFTVSSVTRTGFTVAFVNSAGVAVTRSFSYTAVGYGKQI